MSITRINTNFDALFARQNIQKLELQMGKAMQRISSGKRVNTAADDPYAVTAISTATAQMNGNRVAQQNAQDGLAMLQWADGVCASYTDALQQLRELALTRANEATLSSTQQSTIEAEFTAIWTDYDDARYTTAGRTAWNEKDLFDNSFTAATSLAFQVGPGSADTFSIGVDGLGNTQLTFTQSTITTAANAQTAVGQIDTALNSANSIRASIGQAMRRLENALNDQLSMEVTNASTVSTMGDADLAAEIGNLARDQILSQSATAILAQANTSSQLLLQLLG